MHLHQVGGFSWRKCFESVCLWETNKQNKVPVINMFSRYRSGKLRSIPISFKSCTQLIIADNQIDNILKYFPQTCTSHLGRRPRSTSIGHESVKSDASVTEATNILRSQGPPTPAHLKSWASRESAVSMVFTGYWSEEKKSLFLLFFLHLLWWLVRVFFE